jgi:serine/threonine protein kinase
MEGEKRIEKYQFSLKRLLGEGSYAAVYLGREIEGGRPVAVKVIDKKIFSNAYNVKNIQSEIDIMKKVNHPNIVQLHDIYQTTNNMYIVTELCQQGDLLHLLRQRRRLPEKEAMGYLRDILEGAKYLHKSGIIHRDLKPANILLKDGSCKISDFGFAKSLNSEEAVMKSIVGTPLYMSPQILKKGRYTAKSDLWSIGLIYYEMLHGKTPWPAQNEIELIYAIYHKKPLFAP